MSGKRIATFIVIVAAVVCGPRSQAAVFDLLGPLPAECIGNSTCVLTVDGITATLRVSNGVFHQGSMDGAPSFGADGPGTISADLFDYAGGTYDNIYGDAQVLTITFDQNVEWQSFTVSRQDAGEVSLAVFSGGDFLPFDGSGRFDYFQGCTIASERKNGYFSVAAIDGRFSFDGFAVVSAEGGKGKGGKCDNALADFFRSSGKGKSLSVTVNCDPTNDGIVSLLDFQQVIFCAVRGACERCIHPCDINGDGIEADVGDIRAMVRVAFRDEPWPSDCDDENGCTDDLCVEGTCTFSSNDANCPDDGMFCNGTESCDLMDGCISSGDPCGLQLCDEAGDRCVDCLGDADCPDDGSYCNGAESCDLGSGSCVSSGDPCAVGTTCNEQSDSCE